MTYTTVRNQTTLTGRDGKTLTGAERGKIDAGRTMEVTETDSLGVSQPATLPAAEYRAGDQVLATGVTAGTPGSFSGGVVPYNLTQLTELGALGETTAWTTGQHVVLGDGSQAHWNGTAWAAGAAA